MSAELEPLRSLGFASISATYAAVGTPSQYPARIILIQNATQGNMIFSRDAALVAGELFVPANSFILLDLQTNSNSNLEERMVLKKYTQFYVKQSEAPVSGSVYITYIYKD